MQIEWRSKKSITEKIENGLKRVIKDAFSKYDGTWVATPIAQKGKNISSPVVSFFDPKHNIYPCNMKY